MKKVLNMDPGFLDSRFKGNFVGNQDDTVKACSDEAMALVSSLYNQPHSESATSTSTRNILSGLLKQITSAKKNRSQVL